MYFLNVEISFAVSPSRNSMIFCYMVLKRFRYNLKKIKNDQEFQFAYTLTLEN